MIHRIDIVLNIVANDFNLTNAPKTASNAHTATSAFLIPYAFLLFASLRAIDVALNAIPMAKLLSHLPLPR